MKKKIIVMWSRIGRCRWPIKTNFHFVVTLLLVKKKRILISHLITVFLPLSFHVTLNKWSFILYGITSSGVDFNCSVCNRHLKRLLQCLIYKSSQRVINSFCLTHKIKSNLFSFVLPVEQMPSLSLSFTHKWDLPRLDHTLMFCWKRNIHKITQSETTQNFWNIETNYY